MSLFLKWLKIDSRGSLFWHFILEEGTTFSFDFAARPNDEILITNNINVGVSPNKVKFIRIQNRTDELTFTAVECQECFYLYGYDNFGDEQLIYPLTQ